MLKVVEQHRDEFIQAMMDVTAMKTFPGEEKPVADYLMDYFRKIGVDECFVDGIGNVVAILRGEGKGPNILMNGHMDIVPEGNLDNWAPYDPYKPEIVDGKLIGRGIADMKGAMIAQAFTVGAFMERVIKSGKKLPGDLIFTAVVQEEPAEMFGAEYFFDYTAKEHNIKADVVLLGEPTNGNLCIGQRGKMELVVKTYGKCAHSSTPNKGVDALEFMVPILEDIYSHTGINLEPDPYLGETVIAVTNVIVRPGGTLSTIPDEVELCVDRRYSTTQTEEELLGEFEAIFKRLKTRYPEFKATVEPRYYQETSYTGYTKKVRKWHPAWRVERDNPYVEKAFKALREIGQDPQEEYKKAGTDGSMFCCIQKIPTIIYSGADNFQAHQPKEYAYVDKMVDCLEGYIAIVCAFFGMDRALFD